MSWTVLDRERIGISNPNPPGQLAAHDGVVAARERGNDIVETGVRGATDQTQADDRVGRKGAPALDWYWLHVRCRRDRQRGEGAKQQRPFSFLHSEVRTGPV